MRRNVLDKLPSPADKAWRCRERIRDDLLAFLTGPGEEIELWAWFAAYDHVALGQLWGAMPALPRAIPRFTRELRQRWDDAGQPPLPPKPAARTTRWSTPGQPRAVERHGGRPDDDRPPHHALAGGERETLRAYLDFHRETLALKCAGLSDDDLRRPTTPSSLTLLGLVRHMAEVERAWFRRVSTGQDVPLVWSPDGDFQVAYDAPTRHRRRPSRRGRRR